ncbi:MAG: type II toxin-antitoxin system HicB family antitoxin [Cytophagales bacterium]|nr:type II toxin-antitoxin system HicB family antitoxin [Cytophagales bacterium]
MKNLSFEIEKDDGQFHTWCPELPGCHSHGSTINEAMENLKDAIHLYLDTILEEEISKKSLELAR